MTIKQNGGVFGRNPTFNDVTIEGELTFNGDIDVGSDLKVDGDLEVTGTIAVGNSSAGAKIDVSTGAGEYALRLENGSGAYFRVKDGGLTEVGGNVKFTNAGSGIDFSATSGTGTSELFDDYEEGDFIPVVSDAASGGNNASGYASQVGKYTKVGRMVHFTIKIQNINTSGMTSGNDVFVTGLPFTSSSASNCMCSTLITGITFTGRVEAMVLSGQSYLKLTEVASGASFEDLITVGELTSGTADIFFNGSYFV